MMKAVYWRYEYLFIYYDKVPPSNTVYRIKLNTVQHSAIQLHQTLRGAEGREVAQSLQ